MRYLGGAVLAALCAVLISVGAHAVTAGGFPSFPWFQALGVGETAPTTPGNASISGTLSAGAASISGALSAGGASLGVTSITGTSGSDGLKVYGQTIQAGLDLIDGQAGSKEWSLNSGYCSGGAPGWFDIYNDALGKSAFCITPSNIPEIQGRPLTAALFGGSSSCSVTAGAINAASCTRTGTGQYTLTFSTAYPSTPVCVGSSTEVIPGNIPVVEEISAVSTTSVSVWLMETNTTATGYDTNAYVICH